MMISLVLNIKYLNNIKLDKFFYIKDIGQLNYFWYKYNYLVYFNVSDVEGKMAWVRKYYL